MLPFPTNLFLTFALSWYSKPPAPPPPPQPPTHLPRTFPQITSHPLYDLTLLANLVPYSPFLPILSTLPSHSLWFIYPYHQAKYCILIFIYLWEKNFCVIYRKNCLSNIQSKLSLNSYTRLLTASLSFQAFNDRINSYLHYCTSRYLVL